MSKFLCPHWMGYLLACPLRRLTQNPEKILSPFVTGGMTVLEVGPGMGFFSLPLAGMVGPGGKIFPDNSFVFFVTFCSNVFVRYFLGCGHKPALV